MDVIEHDTFVEASVATTRSGGGTCSLVGYQREASATLGRPLGGRVLVDAATGAAVVVTNCAGRCQCLRQMCRSDGRTGSAGSGSLLGCSCLVGIAT